MEWFMQLNPIYQSGIAGIGTWLCTVFGASFVFLVKKVDNKILAMMQGLAGGIMVAASFWSLLAPALEQQASVGSKIPEWFPAAVGFLIGGIFLRLIDKFVPHLHYAEDHGDTDISETKLSTTWMLFLAITIHNIPEGMAIGVAFAAADIGIGGATLASAITLAIGIGIQNIPEGSALSLPLMGEGKGKGYAFNLGQMSALVEPFGAMIGAATVLAMQTLLPYALSFAAGAMIFVVVEELIPESQTEGNTDIATMSFMVGFVIMMILDVALG
ncbi:ZIP family metal transporter [Facklamia sp. 7083-14-GEN3]|uniref:ZIP family metal transporter n=1 Tax=Facklamia sp. 7083-14-GEN3 TaxID=2973478 RepID=UPI00215B9E6C|nr:ZIP family metal transporter [Facklamia sp. 7083-14-GEN3]MCR8968724.1 ZIP family metal transporter [Facklamia sp. 7083-14-GEN3]